MQVDGIFRFLADLFLHVVVEFLLHGPGYVLRKFLFERHRADVRLEDTFSFVVSVMFWIAIFVAVWLF